MARFSSIADVGVEDEGLPTSVAGTFVSSACVMPNQSRPGVLCLRAGHELFANVALRVRIHTGRSVAFVKQLLSVDVGYSGRDR